MNFTEYNVYHVKAYYIEDTHCHIHLLCSQFLLQNFILLSIAQVPRDINEAAPQSQLELTDALTNPLFASP